MNDSSRLASVFTSAGTLFTALALLVLLAAVQPAGAAVIDLCADLDGDQTVPPVATSGSGVGSLTYDDVTNELCVTLTVADLNAAVTACHIHGPAPVGANAGVQVALPNPDFADFCATLTEGQETDLLAGLYYINVHTSFAPGGEIRGQILGCPVPTEEASWSVVKSAY